MQTNTHAGSTWFKCRIPHPAPVQDVDEVEASMPPTPSDTSSSALGWCRYCPPEPQVRRCRAEELQLLAATQADCMRRTIMELLQCLASLRVLGRRK